MRRWAFERSFDRASRFRRLAPDYDRWPTTVAAFHSVTLVGTLLRQLSSAYRGSRAPDTL